MRGRQLVSKLLRIFLIGLMVATIVGWLPGLVRTSSARQALDISPNYNSVQTKVTESLPITSQSVSSPVTGTWEVIRTIQLTGTERPLQIAISGGKAYVSRNPGHLTVVDLSTNTEVKTIIFAPYPGATPHYIGISGGKAYVALGNLGSDGQLAVINVANNTVSAYIPVGAGPHGVATSGQRVYVTNNVWWSSGDPATVKVVDVNTDSVVATIAVGINPTSVAVDPVSGKAYVTNRNDLSKSVSVIDTTSNSVIATIPINNPPAGVAISGNRAYVATTVNMPNGTVEVIDIGSNKVLSSIPVGRDSWGIAASNDYVFVANQSSDTVSVIKVATNDVLAAVDVGDDPTGIAVDPLTNRVYVTNQGDKTISIIQLRETPQPTTGYSPSSFSFGATQGQNPSSQILSIWNSGGGTLNWSVSDDAAWLTLSPTNGSPTGETDTVAVSASISGMNAGNYSATITISAPEAANTPKTVPVSLTISQTQETITTPDTPAGPTSGQVNQSLTYSTSGASSSLGHNLEYRFDWGDGSYSTWSSSTTASHSWSIRDTYAVRAQARCATHTDILSEWSSGLTVSVTAPLPTSTPCFDGQTCYSTKEAAVSHVPDHVVPRDCFVWSDGPPDYRWRVIPGYGCAHWVAHQLGIRVGATCYEGYSIRVRDVIAGRVEVRIKSCKVGDIWASDALDHCGIVRQLGDGKVLVEHDSSAKGSVVMSWFDSGKCWSESPIPEAETSSAEETPPNEAPQSILEKIQEMIDKIRDFVGFK